MRWELLELNQMLAALRSQARSQEKASKAVNAAQVEATRTAIVKVQKLREKATA
jgi:hypothetical protein